MPLIRQTVAEFLTDQIERCGKLQTEIAEEIGFEKPNVITMIKKGSTKLPLAKIGLMAKSIGVDPILLFSMVIQEYLPETWGAIEDIFKQPILTSNEMQIIMALRDAGLSPREIAPSDRGAIIRAIKSAVPF